MVHAAFAAAAAALLVPAVSAQAAAWAQCGGSSWTGATTCVAGYTCTYSNPYYSQCQPGTGSTTATSTSTSTTKSSTTSSKTTTTSTKTTSTTASPTSTVDTSAHCGQYDSVVAGPYQLNTDLWGKASASSGSQCVHLTGLSGNTVSWSTYWKWTGSSSVVSYADIQLNQGLNKVLSTIQTIPSTAQWTNTAAASIVADVAYDLFTSATASGSNAYEIMIWLANYNAGPISYNYSSSGAPTPVAANIALGGYTWNLYYGSNGYNYVYSFLPASGTIPSFSADINLFLKYLTTYEKLPASQYLTTLQFGTEATNGNATLTVSSYSAVIN